MSRLKTYPLSDTYGGLNTELAPEKIQDNASPSMPGWILRGSGIETCGGWTKFTSQRLTSGAATPTNGVITRIDQYFKNDGTVHLLAFTDSRVYTFRETNDLWVPITPGSYAKTTINATSTSGTKTLFVASTTGFTVGDTLIITDPGGTETEENVVDAILAGPARFTLLNNLTYTHTVPGEEDPVSRTYASAIVDVDSAAGQKVLSISHTNQFLAGEAVLVGLATAREEYGIIDTIQAGVSLTLVANLAYAHTSAQADKVFRVGGLGFASTSADADADTTGNLYYFTDGASPVQVWDATGTPSYSSNLTGLSSLDGGVTWPSVEGIGAITSALKAKFLRAFEGLLVLGHTIEQGVTLPQRIRWSQYGVPTSWINAADGTGQAGYFTFDGDEFITGLHQLKRELLIYRENTIEGMTYVGPPDVFLFRRAETGTGLISRNALVDLGDSHVFLGKDNIYQYNGITLVPIGAPIKQNFLNTLTPSQRENALALYVEERDEVWFAVPTTTDRTSYKAYVYNLVFQKWSGPRDVAATAFGFYELQNSETWDSSTGTWEDADVPWDAQSSQANSPINLMGSDGYIYQVDSGFTQDGTEFTRTYYSKITDCGMSGVVKRLQRVHLAMRYEGTYTVDVYVGYAEHEGDEILWDGPHSLSQDSGEDPHIYVDVHGRVFQVRVEATSAANLRSISLAYIPGAFK